MTGRLLGTLNGQPVQILGEDGGLTIVTPGVVATYRLRKALLAGSDRVLSALSMIHVPVRVRLGDTATLNVAPSPHPLLAWALRL